MQNTDNTNISPAFSYYPFGMLQPNRQYTATSAANYRFGFNGKENDNEIEGNGNSVDFGARIYDTRIGRWLGIDPLQKKYPFLSPYSFSGLNPILFKDMDEKTFVIGDQQDFKDMLQELKDVQSLLPDGVSANIKAVPIGNVTSGDIKLQYEVQLTYQNGTGPSDYKGQEGFDLVSGLIADAGTFEYDVSDKISGLNRVSGAINPEQVTPAQTQDDFRAAIDNLSITERGDGTALGDFANDLPTDGKKGIVRISNGEFSTYTTNGFDFNSNIKVPFQRSKVVFHEMLENFLRSQGDDYNTAHAAASAQTVHFSKQQGLNDNGNTGNPHAKTGFDTDNSGLFKHK